jgi:hypothetical protein
VTDRKDDAEVRRERYQEAGAGALGALLGAVVPGFAGIGRYREVSAEVPDCWVLQPPMTTGDTP